MPTPIKPKGRRYSYKASLEAKVAAYEETLNAIAVWDDGNIPAHWDEPGATTRARNVLREQGAKRPPAKQRSA